VKILPLFTNTVGSSIADIALSLSNATQFYGQEIARSKAALCRAAAREFCPAYGSFRHNKREVCIHRMQAFSGPPATARNEALISAMRAALSVGTAIASYLDMALRVDG
jgi:hypothetical protein